MRVQASAICGAANSAPAAAAATVAILRLKTAFAFACFGIPGLPRRCGRYRRANGA